MTNNQLSIRLEPELKEKARRLNLPLRKLLEDAIRLYDNTLYVKYYDLCHCCLKCEKQKEKNEVKAIKTYDAEDRTKPEQLWVFCNDCIKDCGDKPIEAFSYEIIPIILDLAKAFGYKDYKFYAGAIVLPKDWYNQARALYGNTNPSNTETDENPFEESEENEAEPNEL